ncbi:MAG: hypothetical protein AAGJ87_15100, partial [Pseudomonadota bacterium]
MTSDTAILKEAAPPCPLDFSRACLIARVFFVICVAAAFSIREHPISSFYLIRQDLPALVLMFVCLLVIRTKDKRIASTLDGVRGALRAAPAWAAVFGLIVVSVVGRYVVMEGHALSRDEHMALFDAAVFANGKIAEPIAAEWRAFIRGFNTTFVTVLGESEAWISAYLPVNALFIAAAQTIGAQPLLNPAFAAIGLIATLRIASQLWPGERGTAVAAALLYLTSTQMLAASMTAYAMTGHLALNMAWLMFVLRGRAVDHAVALAIAFLATGLHQIVFAPLFAGPFIALLLWKRRWAAASFHFIGYAAIGFFWMRYASTVEAVAGLAAARDAHPASALADTVAMLLSELSMESLWLMGANLLRFFVWQNLLLAPLIVVAIAGAVRTRNPFLLACALCLIATPIVAGVLLAFQGHGWGYRYMHGLIGVACLLGAAGWRSVVRDDAAMERALLFGSAASAVIITPFLLFKAHEFVAPYAAADRAVA